MKFVEYVDLDNETIIACRFSFDVNIKNYYKIQFSGEVGKSYAILQILSTTHFYNRETFDKDKFLIFGFSK